MSEVRLVIREQQCDWSGTIHASCTDRVVAALSADPTTIGELELAVSRFEKAAASRPFCTNLSKRLDDEPYDAGLIVIDLVARLIVVDSTASSPGPRGQVRFHDGLRATDTHLPYHLADDWHFSNDRHQWRSLSEQRRRERNDTPIRDARILFYGRPMLEFVARRSLASVVEREEEIGDSIRQIHADWLLTPRPELGGACPRDVALERHDHLSWDAQDRCEYWSLVGQCPPGLPESSLAYRYAGFGAHELVMYYKLVRELLWSCRERLVELTKSPRVDHHPESLTPGDFLTTEVPRLEHVREAWLDTPDPEFHRRTPRSIIDRERARLPEAMSGRDAIVDPDCPCCQMMADMPGPAFWCLDGSGMDDDFAFDIHHRTRESWDAEQREWAEHSRKFKAEWAERERLGVTDSRSIDDGSVAIWSRSIAVGDTADVPLGIRVFGFGCHLAELIADLRGQEVRENTQREVQWSIDRLNRDFGNLREILQRPDLSEAAALIEPVTSRFNEAIEAVAVDRPDLAAKCDNLTNELNKLLDPPSAKPDWGASEEDVPF